MCPPGPASSGLAEDRGAAGAEHHRLGRAEHGRDPSTQTLIIDYNVETLTIRRRAKLSVIRNETPSLTHV